MNPAMPSLPAPGRPGPPVPDRPAPPGFAWWASHAIVGPPTVARLGDGAYETSWPVARIGYVLGPA